MSKTKLTLNGKSQLIGVRPEPNETADWWRWILSFDKENSPLNGIEAIQDLPFICLACTGGGEDLTRKLRIGRNDVDKSLLIPIFTSEYSTAELGKDSSDAELLSRAVEDVKNPKHLELTVEDRPVPDIEKFYVEAGPFSVKLPRNHVLEDRSISPGTYRAMSAGYWMKIRPNQGKSNFLIQFGGTGRNGFHTKVRYTVHLPSQRLVLNPLKV